MRRWAVVVAILCGLAPHPGRAHPLAPSSLRLRELGDGTVHVAWRTPSVRPMGEVLVPVLPQRCRPLDEPRSTMTDDRAAVEQRWRVDCGGSLVGGTVSVRGLSRTTTNVVVEVTLADGSSARGLLNSREQALVVPEAQRPAAVFGDYLRLGVEHLLSGVDHVLFVLGLLFLIRRRGRLVQAITAFTVGHSVSLCLSVLGVVRIPQAPIEIAIALTIVALALDIAATHADARPGPIARYPWALCSLFGLLHGLGFAGALAHAGLPAHAIPLSLLSFNLGIEVGQLLIVATALGLAGLLGSRLPNEGRLLRYGPAYAIGCLAAFWVFERCLDAYGLLPY